MTDAVVPFTGWGRGTWGELAFGEGSITNAGASGQVGSVTVVAEANVVLTGVFGTGAVGSVAVEADATVLVTGVSGVQGTGQVGQVLVWGRIVPNQDPGYTPEQPIQSPGWSDETVSQSPGWTRRAA